MIHHLRRFLKPKPAGGMSLKDAIAATKIDTDPKHRLEFRSELGSHKHTHFPNVASTEVVKRLGLVHAPKVRTIDSKATFNQRTSHVSSQLKAGLKEVPVGQLSLFN